MADILVRCRLKVEMNLGMKSGNKVHGRRLFDWRHSPQRLSLKCSVNIMRAPRSVQSVNLKYTDWRVLLIGVMSSIRLIRRFTIDRSIDICLI